MPGFRRSPAEGNGTPPPVFLPGESHGQRSPWRREWHPVQYSCLENPMGRGSPGGGNGTHSSILAWRIPRIEGCSPWGHKESDTAKRLMHTQ